MPGHLGLARAFALVGLLLTFSATHAHAFCRTTTGGVRSGCSISDDDCCSLGAPLYWKNICVGYSLQKDGTEQIPFERVRAVVGAAFQKWSSITCPASSQAVTLGFRQLQDVECSVAGYNKFEGVRNQNVIVFHDSEWPHADGSKVLGLTTVHFAPSTGELLDADMELNTAQHTLMASDPVPAEGYDFESIVTHEAGHFLGLAHSADPEATMYWRYSQGSSNMRTLAADDIAALCSAYLAPDAQSAPYGRRATAEGQTVAAGPCDPEPRHGFSTACTEGLPDDGGCAIRATGDRGSGTCDLTLATLGLVLAVGVARRTTRGLARRGPRTPLPPRGVSGARDHRARDHRAMADEER